MNFWKRQLPALVVFLVGIVMVIQFYIPHPISTRTLEETNRWVRIIRNFALLLGVASLIASHWRKISRRQAGFGYSALVFASFFAMTFFGLMWGIDAPRNQHLPLTIPAAVMQAGGVYESNIHVEPGEAVTVTPLPGISLPEKGIEARVGKELAWAIEAEKPVRSTEPGVLHVNVPAGAGSEEFTASVNLRGRTQIGYWMFQYLKVSMEASMFSLLAFFISSAAFRAFRARSFDATVMLLAAIVMMIGRVSFGEIISAWFSTTWLVFPEVCNWLLNIPVMAAKRAIFLGIALSVIATSVRIIFGIERSYLGKSD